MKTIVCYGDSNTWGYMPKREHPEITANNRFPWGVRWTSLLQMRLGADYRVVEEGLNGRTTMFDDPLDICRNGLEAIDYSMLTNCPVDLVILMLGTNDVKEFFGMPPYVIARGCGRLIDRIQAGGYGPGGSAPQILLVAPIRIGENVVDTDMSTAFGSYAVGVAAGFGPAYAAVAEECHCAFLDASKIAEPSEQDAIHLTAEGHRALAEAICERVKQLLP